MVAVASGSGPAQGCGLVVHGAAAGEVRGGGCLRVAAAAGG